MLPATDRLFLILFHTVLFYFILCHFISYCSILFHWFGIHSAISKCQYFLEPDLTVGFCYRAIPEATSKNFQDLTDSFLTLFHIVLFYFIGLEFILSHISAGSLHCLFSQLISGARSHGHHVL